MKILILVAAATVLCTLLLFALWRHQPSIPGLPRRSAQAQRLSAAWRLWLVFLLSGLVASAIVALAVGEPRESSLGYLKFVLSFHNGDDSWMPMLRASAFLREHPDQPLYPSVFFVQHVKFQYPLTALLPLDLPQWLFGLAPDTVVAIFKILSRLSLVAIGVVFFKLFMGAVQESSGREALQFPPVSAGVMAGLSLLTVALFYPILRSEYHGQIQTAMTLAAGLALLAWQRNQPRLSGLAMALCCIIKPQWVVVILWALLRRQWKFAWTATWVTGACALLAIAVYGPRNFFDYMPVVSFLSKHGESYFINQSLNGLMHRLLANGVNLQGAGLVWSGTDFPPFHPVVYAVTTVSSALILGVVLLWKLGKRPSAVDLSLVMLSLTLASPIAWDHHYGMLLPVFAVLFPAALRRQAWGAWTVPFLWIAFVLSSESFVGATNLLAATRWNVLQSYQFFGAVMVLGLLYRVSWLEVRAPAGVQADHREAPVSGLGRLA
ncbi:hypothetical protein C7T35_35595 [Variovorax sp. WS11]|uniref:glycosyltransferase family 87 protein n=1 Tax=Variovorax sp. WS11 TaxID=1105204 RepID=UPI000D0D0E88|nr:glycosyltransferase family 87 protein [Variovorax sp. WS11]NDZ14586.1 DUF2029 domain-containing protein [Variovorax sp. WS11]PSL79822.1 hypothetical protein C7T35_35595 [Variovorax sp. WS11]